VFDHLGLLRSSYTMQTEQCVFVTLAVAGYYIQTMPSYTMHTRVRQAHTLGWDREKMHADAGMQLNNLLQIPQPQPGEDDTYISRPITPITNN